MLDTIFFDRKINQFDFRHFKRNFTVHQYKNKLLDFDKLTAICTILMWSSNLNRDYKNGSGTERCFCCEPEKAEI